MNSRVHNSLAAALALTLVMTASGRAYADRGPAVPGGGRSVEDMAGIQAVNRLMDKSGLNTQLRHYPGVLLTNIARAHQQKPRFSNRDYQVISLMVAKAFNPDRMIDTVRNSIHTRLTEDDVSAVLAWLTSPLGERITRLEEAASGPAAAAGGPPAAEAADDDADRVARLRKLDRAVKAADAAASSAQNLQVAMLTAMTAAMDPNLRPAFDTVEAEARKRSEQARPLLEKLAFEQMQRIYRPLSADEIDRYTVFAESSAGRKYHAVVLQAVQEATLNASRELGTMIGKRMVRKPEP
jgi:hypothetical protein